MGTATISFGPKLGLLNNAGIGEVYYDPFRPFLRGVDALVQASVIGLQNTPPVSPNNGDAYIVRSVASGLWTGEENKIAVYSNQITLAGTDTLTTGWDFYTPNTGWWVYTTGDGLYRYFNGTAWATALATSSIPGFVLPDNTTVTVNGSGVLSATQAGIATTSVLGLVKPDGTTIAVDGGGKISTILPTATTSVLGVVKADGVTINVSGSGVISAATATTGALGIVKPDGTSITISTGTISATPPPTATTSVLGVVKPDGTTIDVSGGGVISVPTATTGALGLVKADGTTISISGGGTISAMNTGTVTSVGLTMPGEFNVSGSPITGSGSFTVTRNTQTANTVMAGPTSGGAATPTFRGLVAADLPLATTGAFGAVKPDGSTVTISTGVISVPTATTGALGLVKPDGTTVTVSTGTISVPTATTGALGIVKPDGTSITISSGIISATATAGFTSGNNANGYWIKDPLGHYRMWGTVTTDINGGTLSISFPTSFTNASSISVVVTTKSSTDRITFVVDGSVGTSGFQVSNNGSSGYAYWIADGY